MNDNSKDTPVPAEKPGTESPNSRARIRQDKFSTTLHLPCFLPKDEKPE